MCRMKINNSYLRTLGDFCGVIEQRLISSIPFPANSKHAFGYANYGQGDITVRARYCSRSSSGAHIGRLGDPLAIQAHDIRP